MPSKPLKPCRYPACCELVDGGYCEKHKKQETKRYDQQRGTAHERGYTYRWQKYSRWFLKQPENVFCKLQLDKGCTVLAKCVDHIQAPNSSNDPLFWDVNNHQASCIHCNSVKGDKTIKGKTEY